MKISKLIILTLFSFAISTRIPVIGIVGAPYPTKDGDLKESVVISRYVRWIESAGGSVVAVHSWYTEDQIDELFTKVNGFLFQGGDRNLTLSGIFEKTSAYIMKKSMEIMEKEGRSIPVWGTCQGFQLMHLILMGKEDLDSFDGWGYPTSVNITDKNASMFQFYSEKDFDNLPKYAEFHNYGISKRHYDTYPKLSEFFNITSVAYDRKGKQYYNSVQAKKYPIYAVQFHPEAVPFMSENKDVPMSVEAIRISQNIGNFFMNEARKNNNTFGDDRSWNLIDTKINLPEKRGTNYAYTFKNPNVYFLKNS
jgi:gamma-glutamyl hydrolase